MSTRRLAESVEGLNSSLALAVGDLWPKKCWPIVVVKGLMQSGIENHTFGPTRHGLIVIDYNGNLISSTITFLIKLGNLPPHYCAKNLGCSGWVSSFIIVCYGCVSGEAICPSVSFKSK